MLPSTGYFKTIICPFYENGACDRPYCHFKHLRKENVSNTAAASTTTDDRAAGRNKKRETATSTSTANSSMIQQFVSEVVIKALADQGVQDKEKVSENIVTKVVEGLKPTLVPTIGRHMGVPQLISKPPCVYNPTPIAELKRRHTSMPVYMPISKDNKIAVKRKSDDHVKSWSNSLSESIQPRSTELTYKPTAIVNHSVEKDYVATVKSENSLNSYDDSNSSDYISKRKEVYCPKPKKRREEYVPKMMKPPLQSVRQLDELALDDFNSEISMLDDLFVGTDKSSNEEICENSHDFYNIEAKFSDDEIIDDEIGNSTKVVKNSYNNNQQQLVINLNEDLETSENDNNVHSNNKNKNKAIGDNSNLLENSEINKSNRENSTKENTKKSESEISTKDSSPSSSSSGKSHSNDKNEYSRDKKNVKHSSSSSDKHRSSSSSKSSNKSSHKKSSKNSSSHGGRDKSQLDKRSRERDKTRHKSSRHKDEPKKSGSSKNEYSNDKFGKSRKFKEKKTNDEEMDGIFGQSSMNIEDLLDTSDSDHDVEEECLKIFHEYQVSDHQKDNMVKHEQVKVENEEAEAVGKKRVAHPSASASVIRTLGVMQSSKKLPNPQQRMYERWRLMRQVAAEKAAEKAIASKSQAEFKSCENVDKSIKIESQIYGNGRVRIAPVTCAMSLATMKKTNESSVRAPEFKTITQTAKNGPRVAHIPQAIPQLVRPEPLHVATQKFPINVRQYYVNLMHDICIQIYTNGEDATQRALREELTCHERCKALPVYKNSCMLAAHRLRKEVEQNIQVDEPVPSGSGMVSHDAVLAGKTKGSWSFVKTKKYIGNFRGSALYCMLKKWIMTDQQLKDNGFPRPHPDGPKGRAKLYVVNTRNHSIISKVPNERYCSRCGQSYMVNKHGLAVQQQNCIYHWGRKFTIRGEGKYSCCQQYGSASGCCDAKNHVWDHVDPENLRGYVKTLPKDITAEEQGVFALDCEMCYTTQGLELTRVTVIDEDCKVIYETLVKPDNPIIDYNTRFSGITEENMLDVKTSLLEVQATLLTMFSDQTILVGHSLESDFKALKLIHDTVVDTSTVFPHKNGYPQKRALRNLCSEYLRKIIQNDVGGHDSKEDAVACMELIHWKVKEEAKLQ